MRDALCAYRKRESRSPDVEPQNAPSINSERTKSYKSASQKSRRSKLLLTSGEHSNPISTNRFNRYHPESKGLFKIIRPITFVIIPLFPLVFFEPLYLFLLILYLHDSSSYGQDRGYYRGRRNRSRNCLLPRQRLPTLDCRLL